MHHFCLCVFEDLSSVQKKVVLLPPADLPQDWWREEIRKLAAGMSTLLALRSLFYSGPLPPRVDLHFAISQRCDDTEIHNWLPAETTFTSSPFSPLPLFISCSHTANKCSHQARGMSTWLWAAGLRMSGMPPCKRLYCAAVGATRWHRVALQEGMSRKTPGQPLASTQSHSRANCFTLVCWGFMMPLQKIYLKQHHLNKCQVAFGECFSLIRESKAFHVYVTALPDANYLVCSVTKIHVHLKRDNHRGRKEPGGLRR